jgi:hypothetical protein
LAEIKFRNDGDAVPLVDTLQTIPRAAPGAKGEEAARRSTEAPLRINVLADDYWDLLAVLR